RPDTGDVPDGARRVVENRARGDSERRVAGRSAVRGPQMTIGGDQIGCAREAARVEVLPRFGEDPRDGAVSDVAYVDELVVCGERAWVAADGDVLDKGVLGRVDNGHGVRLYHDCFRAAGMSEREH